MSQTPMRRKYSKEFKQDAVNLALKREKPVREIALVNMQFFLLSSVYDGVASQRYRLHH